MSNLSIETQQLLFDVLKRIAREYDSPARLHKRAETDYGISGEEAIEMAYENVRADAERAIRGLRRPALPTPPTGTPSDAGGSRPSPLYKQRDGEK